MEQLIDQLKREANYAAYLMNMQAREGDALRNRVNYGTMTQALRTLHNMGYDATGRSRYDDRGMLICEKITVNGEIIYQRWR